MKLSFKKILGYLFVFASLALAFFYLKIQDNFSLSSSSVNPLEFTFLVFFVLVSLILNGLKILWLQSIFKNYLGLVESFSLAGVNAMWNYLPLTGGLAIRGTYLKQKYKFPWTEFLSTVVASYLISFIAFGFFGLMVTILLVTEAKIIFLSIFSILILTPALVLLVENVLKNIEIEFINKLLKGLLGFKLIFKYKETLIRLILLDFLIILIDSSRIFFVSQFSGKIISFQSALLITPLTIVASLINITPGALIIREALITFTTTQLNYTLNTGLVISTIDRAAVIVGIFISGVLGSIYLSKKLNDG
ncbi:MAG: lysylphosphatidylglycerol synthase domain-containing protein [Candidatus Woykebacteria bacterium]